MAGIEARRLAFTGRTVLVTRALGGRSLDHGAPVTVPTVAHPGRDRIRQAEESQ